MPLYPGCHFSITGYIYLSKFIYRIYNLHSRSYRCEETTLLVVTVCDHSLMALDVDQGGEIAFACGAERPAAAAMTVLLGCLMARPVSDTARVSLATLCMSATG